jgi:hypothetical protein
MLCKVVEYRCQYHPKNIFRKVLRKLKDNSYIKLENRRTIQNNELALRRLR